MITKKRSLYALKTNGEKINALRKLNNLTQAELGAALNVTSQAVSKWERDESEPDFTTLTKMCKLFNITLDDFVNENFKLDEDETKESTQSNVDQLGFCTSCGVMVKESNLGERTPKMLCSGCHGLKIKDLEREAERLKEERLERERHEAIEKRNTKSSFIKKCIFSGIIAVAFLIILLSADMGSDVLAEILFAITLSIWLFAFIYQIRTPGSVVRDAITWFSWIIINMPGIIFELSLDGIIWLLTVKLLFWAVTLLLGVIAIALGLIVSFAISFFIFPFVFVKEINQVRA